MGGHPVFSSFASNQAFWDVYYQLTVKNAYTDNRTNQGSCWLWQHSVWPCVHSKHPAELVGQSLMVLGLESCFHEALMTRISLADQSSQHPSPVPMTTTHQLQQQHTSTIPITLSINTLSPITMTTTHQLHQQHTSTIPITLSINTLSPVTMTTTHQLHHHHLTWNSAISFIWTMSGPSAKNNVTHYWLKVKLLNFYMTVFIKMPFSPKLHRVKFSSLQKQKHKQ